VSEVFGEGRIEIVPDTTRFREKLLTELNAVRRSIPPVAVPVTLATSGAQAARNIQREVAATVATTQAALTSAAKGTSAASREVATAQRLATVASTKLAASQGAVVGAASEAAVAQVQLTRATAAVAAAERAQAAALTTNNAQLITASAETLRLAKARQGEAVSTLQAARSTAAYSSSLAVASRGAAATSLSILGIRGATLAASTAFLAGAAAIAVFAKSIGIAVGFERQLAVFRETAGATADEMERVGAAAKTLGADITLPAVSAADAAEAMVELAKAGLSVEDSIAGARGVLQLATAAAISNADAVELAASALNAFGLAGSQAVRVADVLANAANEAQGSISDIGISLSQAAAVGRQVGLTLEDTVAILTQLAREGLRGSDAGTSLRTALLRLVNPTEKAQAVIDKLGFAIRDASGNIRPDVFVNFGIATEKMGKAQRDAAAAIIFGQDAIRAVAIASRQSITDLLGMRRALTQAGTAADLAAARTEGLGGASQALVSELETIGISVGHSVTPALTAFVSGITSSAAAISESEGVREVLRDSLSTIGDAFDALGSVATTISPALSTAAGSFEGVVTSIGVPELLGGIAAYKLYPAALGGVRTAAAGLSSAYATARIAQLAFTAELGAGVIAASRSAAAFTGLGTSLLALARSPFVVATAVAALTAGLIFLATRETEAEAAQRRFGEVTENLSAKLTAARTAIDNYNRAISDLKTEQVAVSTARLAVEVAKAELAQSDAAQGSLERRQLENALALTLDQLRVAEQRLTQSRKDSRDALEIQQVAAENARAARLREVLAINDVVEAERKRIALAVSFEPTKFTGEAGRVRLLEAESRSLAEVTTEIRKRAAASRATGTVEGIDLAKRLRAIASLKERLNEISTPRVTRLILQSESLEAGLKRVAASFGITGREGVANFIREVVNAKPQAVQIFENILTTIRNIFVPGMAAIGGDSKEAFMTAVAIVPGAGARAGLPPLSLAEQALQAEIGGSLQQQLTIARQREREARRRFERASTKDARTEALEDLADRTRERKALEEQILSEQKAAAASTISAAKTAKEKQDDADQAVLDLVSRREARLAIRAEIASGTSGLQDDIRVARDQLRLTRQSIELVEKQVKDSKTKTQALLALRLQEAQEENALNALIEQRKENQRQAKKAAAERRRAFLQEALELNLEIATERDNRRERLRAIRALLKFWRQVLRDATAGTNAARKARLEIERLKNEEEEILKEQKERTSNFNKLAFEFLQQQQGFAANLLGNLFPASAAGGTVGGGASQGLRFPGFATPTTPGFPVARVPSEGGAAQRPDGALSAQAQAGVRLGPTQGQQQTLIEIMRQILRVLQAQNRGQAAPEARFQRASGSAVMDIL